MVEAVKNEGSKPVLMPEKMGLAEHKRHEWIVDIDPARTVDEILEPGYWAHVAVQMEPLDKIEARWEDGSRIVQLRVRFCERTYAKVKVIGIEELGSVVTEAPATSQLHTIDWKGPVLKFAVIRNTDKVVVQSGFKERSQAVAWMVEHERS